VNSSSIHPFEILSAGVQNNNISQGTITYTVPNVASNYNYICSIHSFGDQIITVAPPPPPIHILSLAVSNKVVLRSTGTNGWSVNPEYSTNLTTTNWFALSILSNSFLNGINETICGRPPGSNVFLRIRSQPNWRPSEAHRESKTILRSHWRKDFSPPAIHRQHAHLRSHALILKQLPLESAQWILQGPAMIWFVSMGSEGSWPLGVWSGACGRTGKSAPVSMGTGGRLPAPVVPDLEMLDFCAADWSPPEISEGENITHGKDTFPFPAQGPLMRAELCVDEALCRAASTSSSRQAKATTIWGAFARRRVGGYHWSLRSRQPLLQPGWDAPL